MVADTEAGRRPAQGETEDEEEKGIFKAILASFKELVEKIKELQRKRRRTSQEGEILRQCQTEKRKRKDEFFATEFGQRAKRRLDRAKREITDQKEEIIDQLKEGEQQKAVAKAQQQERKALEEARKEDEKIAQWEEEAPGVKKGRYKGLAEDEVKEALNYAQREQEQAVRDKSQSSFGGYERRSAEEIIDQGRQEAERREGRALTTQEKLRNYAARMKEYERISLREPYSEMYLRQITREICETQLRPEQEAGLTARELLEERMKEWLKRKLKGISNVGGQTRDHGEAMRLMQAFLENDRLPFHLGADDYQEVKITQELRDLYEAWTKVHDLGEYFKTSGSPEDIKRAAGMMDAKYFGLMMKEKDRKKVTVIYNGQREKRELVLGASDFLDLYDTERWGTEVISRDQDARKKAKDDLARDVIATALGLKKWHQEKVPDFEVEYDYVDEQGEMQTARGSQGLERLVDDFRWANNFAEGLYHQFGRVGYQDVEFKSEVKDWQVKVLRFPRYCHMYGIGTPELRNACDLDFRDFITRRSGELFPMLHTGSSIFNSINDEGKKKEAKKAVEKLVLDSEGWVMSRDRIIKLAEKSYQGRTKIASRNLTASERRLFGQLDFKDEFARIGVQLGPDEGTKGLQAFIKYMEHLGYGEIDWTTRIWGQRPLKYFQYLDNANATRGLMMAFLGNPSLGNLTALQEKGGFGYFDLAGWSKKCREIEEVRHWGMTFHWGKYDKLEVNDSLCSQPVKDEQGETKKDEEGKLIYATEARIGGVPWRNFNWERVPAYEWETEIEYLKAHQMIDDPTEKELKEDFLEWGVPSWEIPEWVPFVGGERLSPVGWLRRIRIALSYIPLGDFLLGIIGTTLAKLKEELEEAMKET